MNFPSRRRASESENVTRLLLFRLPISVISFCSTRAQIQQTQTRQARCNGKPKCIVFTVESNGKAALPGLPLDFGHDATYRTSNFPDRVLSHKDIAKRAYSAESFSRPSG